jgi:hypothetical protein
MFYVFNFINLWHLVTINKNSGWGYDGGGGCSNANTYCGSGSGVTCGAGCTCDDAGNGKNPNVPGGDKLCA